VASRKAVDPDKVVWLAPETLRQQELAEALAKAKTPEDALTLLQERPTRGEYREIVGTEPVEIADGTTALAPVYGDRLVWVDDAPGEDDKGAGHYERFSGEDAEYKPTRKGE
jgi:hypothetical protein